MSFEFEHLFKLEEAEKFPAKKYKNNLAEASRPPPFVFMPARKALRNPHRLH